MFLFCVTCLSCCDFFVGAIDVVAVNDDVDAVGVADVVDAVDLVDVVDVLLLGLGCPKKDHPTLMLLMFPLMDIVSNKYVNT